MASSCEEQLTESSHKVNVEDKKSSEDEIELPKDFEPGASRVGVLLSTGSYEEEIVSNDDFDNFHRKGSCISEIEQGVADVDVSDPKADEADLQEHDKKDDVMQKICFFSPFKFLLENIEKKIIITILITLILLLLIFFLLIL